MSDRRARLVATVASLDPRLPRTVWTLEAGGLVNSFGTGLVLPFVVIYLHNVRGFSLATAGLILATISLASLVTSPLLGPLIDRIGGRATLRARLAARPEPDPAATVGRGAPERLRDGTAAPGPDGDHPARS